MISGIVAKVHSERVLAWAQLDDEYRGYARDLHEMALGERPATCDEIGPIYVRMALVMKRKGVKIV
jgi:hypothetical protein